MSTDFPSTRPYLIRALHEWCTDHGFTPHIAVAVDGSVQVPRQFVSNNEIVLNIKPEATSGLSLGNEYIEFKARFGGVQQQVSIPVGRVLAVYARENGQGMAFPGPEAPTNIAKPEDEVSASKSPGTPVLSLASQPLEHPNEDGSDSLPPPKGSGGRPSLKRIK
jgi:stringent starvation protein B